MTTKKLFNIVRKLPEFKDYPNNRVIKFRHKKGTLSRETYTKLFDHFGYIENVHYRRKKDEQSK